MGEKTIRATSTSHSTESSNAFFRSPFLRFENVTCLLVVFSILLICVFPLTILSLSLERKKKKKTKTLLAEAKNPTKKHTPKRRKKSSQGLIINIRSLQTSNEHKWKYYNFWQPNSRYQQLKKAPTTSHFPFSFIIYTS